MTLEEAYNKRRTLDDITRETDRLLIELWKKSGCDYGWYIDMRVYIGSIIENECEQRVAKFREEIADILRNYTNSMKSIKEAMKCSNG